MITTWRILKDLGLQRYKIVLTQELKLLDHVLTNFFSSQAQEKLQHDHFIKKISFSDEIRFWLNS